jgi:hypothetical protein
MNQAWPSPEATTQHESLTPASITVATHITTNRSAAGRAGSTNCGKNAVKNAIDLGFDNRSAALINP